MHRLMHLGVIIHFTEFETTAVKRPADSVLLAFTGKTFAGSKNYFPMGKGLCAKSHALTTFHLPLKYCKQYKHT